MKMFMVPFVVFWNVLDGSDFDLLNVELCYSTKPFPIRRDQFVYTVTHHQFGSFATFPTPPETWTPRMRSSVVWVRRSFMSLSASAVETKRQPGGTKRESLKRKGALCKFDCDLCAEITRYSVDWANPDGSRGLRSREEWATKIAKEWCVSCSHPDGKEG